MFIGLSLNLLFLDHWKQLKYFNTPVLSRLSGLTLGAGKVVVREGQKVEIHCDTKDTNVIWFRALDTFAMEFLAYHANSGLKAKSDTFASIFSESKLRQKILVLSSFNKARDSGLYSCASLKSNKLIFGEATRLVGGESCFINLFMTWWKHFRNISVKSFLCLK